MKLKPNYKNVQAIQNHSKIIGFILVEKISDSDEIYEIETDDGSKWKAIYIDGVEEFRIEIDNVYQSDMLELYLSIKALRNSKK